MQTNDTKIWFPAKKYGWGWGPPCSWQGWLVMAVWLALLVGGAILLVPRYIGLFVAYSVVLGLLLVVVALAKGEKPRWRWGEEDLPQTKSAADRLAELEELRSRHLVSNSEYETKRREILRDI